MTHHCHSADHSADVKVLRSQVESLRKEVKAELHGSQLPSPKDNNGFMLTRWVIVGYNALHNSLLARGCACATGYDTCFVRLFVG